MLCEILCLYDCVVDFMIQQPNLEVLNPTTLDDFLDKMEPMEGILYYYYKYASCMLSKHIFVHVHVHIHVHTCTFYTIHMDEADTGVASP